MALNRFFTRPASSFNGFDDFFAPSPLWGGRDPFADMWFPMTPMIPRMYQDINSLSRRMLSPGYEIHEMDDKYSIAIDVPGIKASDMKCQLEQGRILHLQGERQVTTSSGKNSDSGDNKSNEAKRTETIKFDQRFSVGSNISTSKITADLTNGVLVVSAPKLQKEASQFRSPKADPSSNERPRMWWNVVYG